MGSIIVDDTSTRPLINLQLGWPSPRLFANIGLLDGAQSVLTNEAEVAKALVYGPHQGHTPLRESIAEWLSSVYAQRVRADGIAITNGASANLANIMLKFSDPSYTRKIFMVEPTYFLACPMFEDTGFKGKLRGIPENEDGIDIAFARRELEAAERQRAEETLATGQPDVPQMKTGPSYPKVFKYVIYCVPTYSNPSARTFSVEVRRQLVELAREFDALVVSDDVYDFLSWPAHGEASSEHGAAAVPPPRLVDIDRDIPGRSDFGNAVSNGSFSKIVGPGIRVGWSDSAPLFASTLGEVGSSSSGGAPSHLTSTFLDKMLRAGRLQQHITDTIVPVYAQRYRTLVSAINTHLTPLGVTLEGSGTVKDSSGGQSRAGGFFIYIRLPPDITSAKAVATVALQKHQLRVAFGQMFVIAGDDGSHKRAEQVGNGFGACIRLCWAWHEEGELTEGVERLAAAIVDVKGRYEEG